MLRNLISEIYSFSGKEQRSIFFRLQILIIFSSIMEIISIASLGLFAKIISEVDIVTENKHIYQFYSWLGAGESDFIFYLGFLVLIILMFGSILSVFTVWRTSLFASQYGAELGNKLFKNYMNQPWSYHLTSNSSELTKKVSVESIRVTDKILTQLMLMNARIVLVFCITIAIFVYEPIITIIGSSIFALSYFLLYKGASKRLLTNGGVFSNELTRRFKLLSEGLGGIQSVITLNKKDKFIKDFDLSGIPMYQAHGANVAISMIPKFFMEFVIFGGFVSLIMVLIYFNTGNLSSILPQMSVFGVVAIKFLPAFQQVYNGLTQIKGNLAAWEEIKEDLTMKPPSSRVRTKERMKLGENIQIRNMSFRYSEKSSLILHDINIDIKTNKVIGIIGPSGSGKSTLVNLIAGLLTPSSGSIVIGNKALSEINISKWYNNIGYVPQNVYLTDQTIMENIAFGIDKGSIDRNKVNSAVSRSNLTDFIDTLPNKLNTMVGEQGVQISGGQKQRIGIARALYNEPDVVIFDEATSSLDGVSEKRIMETIENLQAKLVILVAHRLNTIKKCDIIFLMNHGEIVDQGSYAELYKRNHLIQEMENETEKLI
jgi:ATP-binding cassette, subfamily B, bacterial PglK